MEKVSDDVLVALTQPYGEYLNCAPNVKVLMAQELKERRAKDPSPPKAVYACGSEPRDRDLVRWGQLPHALYDIRYVSGNNVSLQNGNLHPCSEFTLIGRRGPRGNGWDLVYGGSPIGVYNGQ